jgi:hypothetical protein
MIVFFHLLEIALLIIILVFVVLIYMNQQKEKFDNCFGMQYYGEPFNDNKNDKICAQGTTEPLYREGGCAIYDPSKISQEYSEGKFTKAV